MSIDTTELCIKSFWLDWELKTGLAILQGYSEAYKRYNEGSIANQKMRFDMRSADFDAKLRQTI